MSEAVATRPIYELSSSERLKEALAQLPPHPRVQSGHPDAQKLYTQFDVMDHLTGRTYICQMVQDTYSDRPCEGVGSYYRSFKRGHIGPDGEVLVLNNEFGWRQAVIEYHGGWIITIMNERTYGWPPDRYLSALEWSEQLSTIENSSIAAAAIDATLRQGVSPFSTLKDFLLLCHDIHRKRTVTSHHDPKILYV